jgi:hypothetical protein
MTAATRWLVLALCALAAVLFLAVLVTTALRT